MTKAAEVGPQRTGLLGLRLTIADIPIAGGLVVTAAALRFRPLAPSSLWLDDAWVALVNRADTFEEVLLTSVSAPGFSLLLKGWLSVVGFSELAAQTLPFLAGVTVGALAYWIAVAHGLHRAAALAGAGLLLIAPAHMIYATRVKQYTIDAVVGLAILAVAWGVLDDPSRRSRWRWLLGVSVAGTVISASVGPVVAGAVAATGLVAAVKEADARRSWLFYLGGYAVFATLWWALVIEPGVTQALRDYWSFAYIDLGGGIPEGLSDLWGRVVPLAEGFFRGPAAVTIVGLLAAAAVTAIRRLELGLLFGVPVLVALALAALQLAPLGGGRTDIYLFPTFALTVGFALDPLARKVPVASLAIGVAALVFLLLGGLLGDLGPSSYPGHDIRPLVEELEIQRSPGDRVLVYGPAHWAYGLYTPAAVEVIADTEEPVGFNVEIRDNDVRVMPHHRNDPELYRPAVARAANGAKRVWLIVSHFREDAVVMSQALEDLGYKLFSRDERRGAYLELWALS